MFINRTITKGALVAGLASISLASPAFAAKVVGDSGNNTLTGTNKHDFIAGKQGNDTISGLKGWDRILGGQGNDSINGKEGNDNLTGDVPGKGDLKSRDRIWGGPGADTIHGGDARDHLFGGPDNDTVFGDAGPDFMSGGSGDDVQDGGAGNDTIYANVGNDKTYGGDGNDELWALTQKDTGADGGDYVNGGNGRDVIRTRDLEADVVNCGPGKDTALLDNLDVIEDATPQNPNGSCENVVREAANPADAGKEDQTQDPSTQDQQQ